MLQERPSKRLKCRQEWCIMNFGVMICKRVVDRDWWQQFVYVICATGICGLVSRHLPAQALLQPLQSSYEGRIILLGMGLNAACPQNRLDSTLDLI